MLTRKHAQTLEHPSVIRAAYSSNTTSFKNSWPMQAHAVGDQM